MPKQWSVEQILASLEAEAAVHRERAAHFAEHEAFYREKRIHHETHLESITRRLDAFRAAHADALDLVRQIVPDAAPPDDGPDFGPASKPRLTRIVNDILKDLRPDQPFGPGWLSEEANRRHGERLRNPITSRQMSDVLRRLEREGKLQQVRQGKARRESRFVRVG